MARATDWWILRQGGDPIPLNPDDLHSAFLLYWDFADVVAQCAVGVNGLLNDPALDSWLGKSGEAFKGAFAPFPGMLGASHDSYSDVAMAFKAFASNTSDQQQQADALVGKAMAAHQSIMGIAGLDDKSAQQISIAQGYGGFEAAFAGAGGNTSLGSLDVYDTKKGDVLRQWNVIQGAADQLPAILDRWNLAKRAFVGAVQEASDRANKITAISADGQSLNFGVRFQELHGNVNDLVFSPDAGGSLELAELPPAGSDPMDVKNAWAELTTAQQQALMKEHADLVGNLDGIPVADRDKANRQAMSDQLALLRAELAALQAKDPGNPLISDLQTNIKGILQIQDRATKFAQHDPPIPFYVLGFDTQGTGHVITSVGDPTTAKNVAVSVPGTSTDLGWSGFYIDASAKVQDTAANLDPNNSVASIYWQGYTAPHSILPDAAFSSWADAGQPKLASFFAGLPAVTEPGTHFTVIGHSYGSLVVGDAVKQSGMRPDDVVFIGSPGVGVDHAADLGMDPNHVWSSRYQGDPIQFTPPVSAVVEPWELSPFDPAMRFGNDPTSDVFGGKHFFSGSGFPNPDYHTAYWDDGSTSLHNISAIVANDPGKIWGETSVEAPGKFPTKPMMD